METRTAATRNGSPSTGHPPAWATGFNTSFGPKERLANSEDSVARLMAEQRGRLQLVFLTRLSGVRSTLLLPVTFLLGAELESAANFGVFARPMRRTRLSRQRLTRSRQSTWAAALSMAAQLIRAASPGKPFYRLTVPAPPLTITST